MYTVKQLADLAGVSRRTLQYYDRIGLLRADSRTVSDYRNYGEDSLYRLQQILLFKEMGMDLKSIGSILECPSFELKRALEEHGKALQARIERLERLKKTVDDTIGRLTGENEMKDRELFGGLSPEQEEAYRREAVERWGSTAGEILRGLGDMYCDDPRFHKTMASYHEDLPEFMRKAIGIYVSARES